MPQVTMRKKQIKCFRQTPKFLTFQSAYSDEIMLLYRAVMYVFICCWIPNNERILKKPSVIRVQLHDQGKSRQMESIVLYVLDEGGFFV